VLHANVSCVQGNEVEVVESFVYGSLTHCSGGSNKLEIKRRAAFIRESMFALDQNIWGSHWKPSSGSTIRVFSQYFCMVLRYVI